VLDVVQDVITDPDDIPVLERDAASHGKIVDKHGGIGVQPLQSV
jgi:hypothetical protein